MDHLPNNSTSVDYFDSLFENMDLLNNKEYKAKIDSFYLPFFDSKDDMNAFFSSVFSITDKAPRRMLNAIQRFITLANNINILCPDSDALRILFFRICLESLNKNSVDSEEFYDKFCNCFTKTGKQYILENFFILEDENIELTEGKTVSRLVKKQLTINEFIFVIKATRDAVVHNGEIGSMQFFEIKSGYPLTTCFQTKEDVLTGKYNKNSPQKMYRFSTSLQYYRFTMHFTKACINYLKLFVKQSEKNTIA